MFRSKQFSSKKHSCDIRSLLATSFLLTFASNTFALEEGSVSQPLSPASKLADEVVGLESHWTRDGEPYIAKTVSVDDEKYSVEGSNGCNYTNTQFDFAPTLNWENCNGKSGSQTITKTKGSPWPMQLKNKFSYNFKGKYTNGDSLSGRRTCKVKEQVRVTVPAGEFDTYKVVCADSWSTRTWWIAPELNGGTTVAFKRRHKTDATRNTMMEMTKVVTP